MMSTCAETTCALCARSSSNDSIMLAGELLVVGGRLVHEMAHPVIHCGSHRSLSKRIARGLAV
jgi:hypothetical protein